MEKIILWSFKGWGGGFGCDLLNIIKSIFHFNSNFDTKKIIEKFILRSFREWGGRLACNLNLSIFILFQITGRGIICVVFLFQSCIFKDFQMMRIYIFLWEPAAKTLVALFLSSPPQAFQQQLDSMKVFENLKTNPQGYLFSLEAIFSVYLRYPCIRCLWKKSFLPGNRNHNIVIGAYWVCLPCKGRSPEINWFSFGFCPNYLSSSSPPPCPTSKFKIWKTVYD